MGAGSAKGLKQEDEEDLDRFSTSSVDQWNDDSDPEGTRPTEKDSVKEAGEGQGGGGGGPGGEEKDGETMKGGKKRKNIIFRFGKWQDDDEADTDEEGENDKKSQQDKKDNNNKENNKKDTEKKPGFRFFGWRKEDKKEEKDEVLEKDIDDLEKTFDSLGIVGRPLWDGEEDGEAQNKPKNSLEDDPELMKPMRLRRAANLKKPRDPKGKVTWSVGSSSTGSQTSRRTFRYSWETDEKAPVPEDEWEYKTVVIEGFDIEKFKLANVKDPSNLNTFAHSLPNSIGENGEAPLSSLRRDSSTREAAETVVGNQVKSPLRYDASEQQILASIERDFTY
ncbi:uncharacterized protein LOC143019017 [Oratosquilla oratoria]|uniref:uncharacterized protein LOC143019017 n=1 Tax=Oratosquilla oratoria TaxID=337810 RepID=UPI003F75D261